MKLDRRIAIVATCLVAASLTQCKASPTAPFDTRTYSVSANPVLVPAVPTAPVVISTNDPNSHVLVTLPVAAQQAIVAAAGGSAIINMTDVAPPEFGTLPAGDGAKIGPRPLTVLQFTITTTAAAASASVVSSRARSSAIAAQASSASAVSFTIQLSGATCNTSILLYAISSSGLPSLLDNSSFTLNAGPPATISGSTTAIVFNQLMYLLDFECSSAKVTSTGGTGGNGGD